ncbi:hypothetical protein [Qipengyuania qiaonensis]|uniref:Uncharacterized protein n=1 Tax=Qipengyuania qiaonensis TaxID=2867240 RepID=A0ABS7J970_9SPHN|nr:hypothetical protein [Qipengyuania qiaonensis]MBX7481512.1 hypothetical protein [Qipengyuania qiaonensis]
MAGNTFFGQGKKLIAIGVFLVLVTILVGGEEDPGVIGDLAEIGSPPGTTADVAQLPSPVERFDSSPATASREDSGLSSWYAQSDSSGAVDPQPVQPSPVDDSHLINDAKPLVSTDPIAAPSSIVVDSSPPAPVE